MLRRIVGFRQDDVGDWVADLSCMHSQHVRHQPPFRDRRWVLDDAERNGRIGTDLECPLCDRAELPDHLRVLRSAGPFDVETLPAGLRGDHRIAEGRWGRLRVIKGSVGFQFADAATVIHLRTGDEQAIPPAVAHRLVPEGPMEIVIEFLGRE